MTVYLYRSTDAGAPALSGTAGSLINLLDACLVNGYGNQAVTITRSGNIATITTPAPHGLIRLAKYAISGADQAEYNGEKSATVTSATTLTFNVTGNPATPATGTITGRLPGAGWTKAFSGTNKAAYQQGVGSNQMFMRVDDTATGAGALARVVGYEYMTGVDTGVNAFPTETQFAGGTYFSKSSDATARPWLILASEKTLHYVANQGVNDTLWTSAQHFWYGDLLTAKAGDLYHTSMIGGASNSNSGTSQLLQTQSAWNSGANTGSYLARAHNQTGGSVSATRIINSVKGNSSVGAAGMPYPGIDLALHVSPYEITEPGAGLRGRLPGVWAPLHNKPLPNFSTFDGTGVLAGKTLLAVNGYNNGQIMLEISDTW